MDDRARSTSSTPASRSTRVAGDSLVGSPVGLEVDAVSGGLRAVGASGPRAENGRVGGGSGPGVSVRVGVVLPVYNESGLIARTFAAVAAFADEHPEYHFLFVDDGSRDGTPQRLRELIDEHDRARPGLAGRMDLLAYAPNRGKGHAVKTGMAAAAADGAEFVLFTDGDLAYSLDHLPRLAEALANADMVIGNRNLVHKDERNTTLMRRVMGWTFNRCARVMLGLRFTDTQAGLKGFRAGPAGEIFAREHLGGFAFDVELVYVARRLGYRVAEIPAHVSEEHSYKVSKVNLLKDPARMFGALLDVRLSAARGRYGPRRR